MVNNSQPHFALVGSALLGGVLGAGLTLLVAGVEGPPEAVARSAAAGPDGAEVGGADPELLRELRGLREGLEGWDEALRSLAPQLARRPAEGTTGGELPPLDRDAMAELTRAVGELTLELARPRVERSVAGALPPRVAGPAERQLALEAYRVLSVGDGYPGDDVYWERRADRRREFTADHFGWSVDRVLETYGQPDESYARPKGNSWLWRYEDQPEAGRADEFVFHIVDGRVYGVNLDVDFEDE